MHQYGSNRLNPRTQIHFISQYSEKVIIHWNSNVRGGQVHSQHKSAFLKTFSWSVTHSFTWCVEYFYSPPQGRDTTKREFRWGIESGPLRDNECVSLVLFSVMGFNEPTASLSFWRLVLFSVFQVYVVKTCLHNK